MTVMDKRQSAALDETQKWPGIVEPKAGRAEIAPRLTIAVTHFSSDHLPQASYHSLNSYSPNRLATDRIKFKKIIIKFFYIFIFQIFALLSLPHSTLRSCAGSCEPR